MALRKNPDKGVIVKDTQLDLLTGLSSIAAHLGWTKRQAEHRAASGEIPTFLIGRTVCALRSKLDAHMAALHVQAEIERKARAESGDA